MDIKFKTWRLRGRLVVAAAIAVATAAACRPGGEPEAEAELQVYPSDEEVMAKAYDPMYTVPPGFLVDERADTPGSYTIHHVKDLSVSYELCTDSYAEASAWEAADNESRAVSGLYVGPYENDRYFEFIRELEYTDGVGNTSDPKSPGFSRVFKCSYVNRDGADRNLLDGYAGTLNTRPLSQDTVRTFAEYLWQFRFFWPARATVLESVSGDDVDAYEHSLLLALVTNLGSDRCDLVEVVDWLFRVDQNSGEVTKEFTLLYSFEAELVDGTPLKCEV